MLEQILTSTPKWVFVIFFVLLAYGWLQTKTRELNKVKVAMLPVIMILLSIGGVFSSFGAHPGPLVAWVAGFAGAVALNQVIQAPGGVRYDPATARFHVPGTWVPLMLMMAIYFAKYTVGVTTALHPDIAAGTPFAAGLSLLFGGVSGTFFARFLRIWAIREPAPVPHTDWNPAS